VESTRGEEVGDRKLAAPPSHAHHSLGNARTIGRCSGRQL